MDRLRKEIIDTARVIKYQKNWTLEDMAGKLGISKSSLGDILANKQTPSRKVLKTLCDMAIAIEAPEKKSRKPP